MRQSNYLNSYRSEFEKKFSSCKAVSFDVFDTILLRPCLRAVDMFRLVQKRCGLDNSFPDIRQKAEWMVRNESAASEEITLTEIYKKIQKILGFTSTKIDQIYEEEIKTELDHLCINPEIKSLYEMALSEHKKIIFCSDMYLPQNIITSALQQNGIREVSSLYVSSNFGCTKSTGSLFNIMLKDLSYQGIMPKEVIHIGDNRISDVLNARRAGIQAVWYPSPVYRFQKTAVWKKMESVFDWDSDDTFLLGNAVRLFFSSNQNNTETLLLNTAFSLYFLLGGNGGIKQNEIERQAMGDLIFLLSSFPEFEKASGFYQKSFQELFSKDGAVSWGNGRLFSILLQSIIGFPASRSTAFSKWKKQYSGNLQIQFPKRKVFHRNIEKKEIFLNLKEQLHKIPLLYFFLRKFYRFGRWVIENDKGLLSQKRRIKLKDELQKSFVELEHITTELPAKEHTILIVGHMPSFDKGTCRYLNEISAQMPFWNWVFLSETPQISRKEIAQKIHIPFLVVPKCPFEGCFDKNLSIPLKNVDYGSDFLTKLKNQIVMNLEQHFPKMGKGYAEYLYSYFLKYTKSCLSLLKPSLVLVWNAFIPSHEIWKYFCQESSVPILWMEFGSLAGTLTFDQIGQMGESSVCRNAQKFLRLKVTEKEREYAKKVCSYLVDHQCNRNPQISNFKEEKSLKNLIVPHKPIILYFGQSDYESGLYHYTSITQNFHSPYYRSSISLLHDLSEIGLELGWNIVYKPHPEMVRSSQVGEIPSNVIVISELSIFKLIEISDVVVTIASQCSYEAVLRKKPVVMLGRNQLHGKGIVFEAEKSNLKETIQKALQEGFSSSRQEAFELHVAQMLKYYLYDDMAPRELRFGKSQIEFLETLKTLIESEEGKNGQKN